MSFATQGSISGVRANPSSMVRGSSAGGAVAASGFNVNKFTEEVNDSMNKDVKNLQKEVKDARKEDVDKMENDYEKQLDYYADEKNQKEIYDASYNKYKGELDEDFKGKKSSLLDDIKDAYKDAKKELKDDFDGRKSSLVKELDKGLSDALKDYEKQFNDRKGGLSSSNLKKLQASYDDAVKTAKSQYEADKTKYVNELTTNYNKAVKDLDAQQATDETKYLGELQNNYDDALKLLTTDLGTQIKNLVLDSQTAKNLKNEKATKNDISFDEIRNFQNEFIDNLSYLNTEYDKIYSNQLKLITDNYNDYRADVLKQVKGGRGYVMFGKRTIPRHKAKIPSLRSHVKIHLKKRRSVKPRRKICIKKPVVRKVKRVNMAKKLTRNFRRIL